ncbi:GNAT family N-acetyltransferase [Oryzifoliimicrobium ureilyticus]|uniref:GNAT family N-acetyltransferase n=1 Tax=Oryzifoliimicrobium ureilyticus TaxID=3113724 RepID=UPI003076483E
MTAIVMTERLVLRNWRDADRDLFHEINWDPEVMEFFPKRRSRVEADTLLDEVILGIEKTGLGFYALALGDTDETLGFCGLARTNLEPYLPDGTVEIGWRLARRHWGKGYVTESARALLCYGFETLDLPEIVSFAVVTNHRSTAVMKRIGMHHDPARDFKHPRVPNSLPHLQPCVLYALDRLGWRATCEQATTT